MIQKIGNKLQVEIDAGGEKTKKITFTNVMMSLAKRGSLNWVKL